MTLFPKQIKEFRETLKMTQSQFAHLLGVTVGSVNKWENDKCGISPLAEKRILELMKEAKSE